MVLDDSLTGILNLANYTLDTVSVPAVTANITAAVAIGEAIVDLTVDIELSFGALYRLTLDNVTDLAGNAIDPALRIIEFKGFQPPVPAGRSFQLWDMFPLFDRRRDERLAGRPLRKFVLILQDVTNLLLCEIDRWTEIIDIDLAPEQFLDAILCDLGNPFTFVDLDVNAKRRLARILVDIYKEKGTSEGIVNAIRFFLGIEVEIDPINCRTYWQIGLHQLNLNTVIGPGIGSPLWYSFYIISPVILTDEQRSIMLQIATYMKAAHEHILGIIEPGSDTDPKSRWIIGVSLMGGTTILSE
jgi:phage tail-like protein